MTFRVQFGIYLWACGAKQCNFVTFWKILSRSNKFQIELEVVQLPIQTELGFDLDIEMFSLAKLINIKNGNCF